MLSPNEEGLLFQSASIGSDKLQWLQQPASWSLPTFIGESPSHPKSPRMSAPCSSPGSSPGFGARSQPTCLLHPALQKHMGTALGGLSQGHVGPRALQGSSLPPPAPPPPSSLCLTTASAIEHVAPTQELLPKHPPLCHPAHFCLFSELQKTAKA